MKRNLPVFTKRDIQGLKRALKKEGRCPFFHRPGTGCERCMAIFPTLEKRLCPCDKFSCSYVRRIVKQIIKEFESGL